MKKLLIIALLFVGCGDNVCLFVGCDDAPTEHQAGYVILWGEFYNIETTTYLHLYNNDHQLFVCYFER